MTQRGAILIASVSVGAGHIRAAEAVREAIVAADPSRQIDFLDVLDFGPRWARRVYRDGYLRVAAISRRAAYQLYVGTDRATADHGDHRAERYVFRSFREYVERGPWQDVVCTHFLPCQVVDRCRRPAMHLVVTDYALHRYWVQPSVDNFFVATDAMADSVRARLPQSAAHATGIPVLARFRQCIDSAAVRRDLHLDSDAPTALIMGGGWGIGVEEMVRNAMRARVPGLAIIVICGANARAYRSLSRTPSDRLRTFAYVDDVARLMAASDLVISKPGGVTTSEALALSKPLLLLPGLPGHEDRNAQELTRLGAADLVQPCALAGRIEHFFQNPALTCGRTGVPESSARSRAAETIARHFERARELCA